MRFTTHFVSSKQVMLAKANVHLSAAVLCRTECRSMWCNSVVVRFVSTRTHRQKQIKDMMRQSQSIDSLFAGNLTAKSGKMHRVCMVVAVSWRVLIYWTVFQSFPLPKNVLLARQCTNGLKMDAIINMRFNGMHKICHNSYAFAILPVSSFQFQF